MTRKMMSEICCHVERFNFAVLVVFGPLKHFKDLLSWSWNGRAQRMATARSQPSSISIGMFQSESVSEVAMFHILRISQSVWNKIGHGGIVCNMYSSTNPCQRFNLMLSDIFAKLGRLHISDRKESWTWRTRRCTKVIWSVSGWAAELRDVDMSGYPILLSQCPPGESHISPYLHKSFGTSHSLPRFLWAVSHGQNCRLSISKTCFQKGPWRYPTSGWMTKKPAKHLTLHWSYSV